jgi:hypothetical protein
MPALQSGSSGVTGSSGASDQRRQEARFVDRGENLDQPRIDVFCIGVQKAATSWLFQCLTEHPEVRPARVNGKVVKEINFFNHFYERGYSWYHRFYEFGTWSNVDFSILYFHDRNVPERLFRYNPDARLLLALRDPVERALSHHRHEIRHERLARELYSFWPAAELNPCYIEQGFYATHLSRWLEYFDRNQILAIDHAEVLDRPAQVLHDVCTFLGVRAEIQPRALYERVNLALVPRRAGIEATMRFASTTIRTVFGDRIARAVRSTDIVRKLRMRNRVPVDDRQVPPLSPEERLRLAAVFSNENGRLQTMLGRDLSHWTGALQARR